MIVTVAPAMLLVRKDRVTVVPAISLVMTVVLTVALVHELRVEGESLVRLLPGFALPAIVFAAAAAFLLCRLERRGERIHWGRLRLRSSEDAKICAIRAEVWKGRYEHLEVALLVRGQPVLTAAGLRNGPKADAKAQRVAEALGLPLEREPSPTAPAQTGAKKRTRSRRHRDRRKR